MSGHRVGWRGSVRERFYQRHEPEPNSGCWLWTGSVDSSGYGTFRDGRVRGAHRVAWELHVGSIPAGLCVLHRCDNPSCVNPDHLFLGTRADNNADKMRKGRDRYAFGPNLAKGSPGVRNGRAKLDEDAVRRMRELWERGGLTLDDLGARFGVGASVAFRVVHRQSWRHVA